MIIPPGLNIEQAARHVFWCSLDPTGLLDPDRYAGFVGAVIARPDARWTPREFREAVVRHQESMTNPRHKCDPGSVLD